MNAYVFASLALAQQAVANLELPAASGGTGPYPKAGTDIGGGNHAPPSQSLTLTYAAIYQNAAGTSWALVADGTTQALLPVKMPVPGVVNIDINPGGNWAGAVQVYP